MKILRVVMQAPGGPEVMELREADLPPPGPGEVQIEHRAIGVNYLDVYQRRGIVPLPLPSPLGLEAAGEVVAVGDGVTDLWVGDRVAYAGLLGAYASHRNAPADRCVKIPEDLMYEKAAAALLKGMTVEYLLCRTYAVSPGEDVLFWAASGGVGHLAGQWGRSLGARMIGVTSGPENCREIVRLGYADAVDRTAGDVPGAVLELTAGKGVPVVYDSVGAASFDASIACLARRGMMVSFGATTGPAPDVSPSLLQSKGSLYFTRPTLADYVATREDLLHSANETFRRMTEGELLVNIHDFIPLTDVAKAHTALESGKTAGALVLTV